MYAYRTRPARRENRFQFTYFVIDSLRWRGWVSVNQVATAAYYGQCRRPHPQQKKRVQELLDRYVRSGILMRNTTMAECPIYRHRGLEVARQHPIVMKRFWRHAMRGWSPSKELTLALIKRDLNLLVPLWTHPSQFAADGTVLPRPWPNQRPVSLHDSVLGVQTHLLMGGSIHRPNLSDRTDLERFDSQENHAEHCKDQHGMILSPG